MVGTTRFELATSPTIVGIGGKMVGTTRFELATSPTPRVRSTRLSHVPTIVAHRPGMGDGRGLIHVQVYTMTALAAALDWYIGGANETERRRDAIEKNRGVDSLRCNGSVDFCAAFRLGPAEGAGSDAADGME